MDLESIKMHDDLAPCPDILLVSLRVHCFAIGRFEQAIVRSKMTNLRSKIESTTTKKPKLYLWTIEPS